MDRPLVTVVIPVYNGSNYLREAIDSVLNQTYSNIEIIVVNDGSDDNGETEKAALEYGDSIQYICKENGGVATALNEGIRCMHGDYFSWLSHDDIFYPEKVEKQLSVLTHEDVDITACSYHIFYDSGRKIDVPILDFYGENQMHNSVFSVINSIIQFGGVLFHKKIFDKYGVFREDLRTTQDYEFLFRVLRKERCVYSNELLYGIRYHENQGSNTIKSVDAERDEMYCMFINSLTEDEKRDMYGSVYQFYYQMLLRVWPIRNMQQAMKLCINGLVNESETKRSLHEGELNPWSENPVLIYGAGLYGKRLLFDLRCRGIAVAGFLDGNSALWGQVIDGVCCYSLEDVKRNVVRGTIIIASLFREEIAARLKANGITFFWYKEGYDRCVTGIATEWSRVQKVLEGYDRITAVEDIINA